MLFQYKMMNWYVVYKAQMGKKVAEQLKIKDRLLLPFGYAGSAMV
jgi:hypothetical protein